MVGLGWSRVGGRGGVGLSWVAWERVELAWLNWVGVVLEVEVELGWVWLGWVVPDGVKRVAVGGW